MNAKRNMRNILVFGAIAILFGATFLPNVTTQVLNVDMVERISKEKSVLEENHETKKVINGITSIKIETTGMNLGNILYVGGSGPGNYSSIRDAINAASSGDTVFVYNGTYYENVAVDKTINLVGEKRETTIISSFTGDYGNAISVSADGVKIGGFTIQKSKNGIKNEGNLITIHDNIFTNNSIGGVSLVNSNNNTVFNNSFFNDGLYVYDSSQNIIYDNTVNGKPLVYLEGLSNKVIDGDAGQVILLDCDHITVKNQILSNTHLGIKLVNTNNCFISDNTISDNLDGISLYYSNENIISNNNISLNSYEGIILYGSSNNTIAGNTVLNNRFDGINFHDSSNNTIADNNISYNYDGINIFGIDGSSSNNCIKGNIIDNNHDGIDIFGSSNKNSIDDNTLCNNYRGIYGSHNNIISDNIFSNNTHGGIYLGSKNFIFNNSFFNDGLLVSNYYQENTIYNNMVNDKPLIYLAEKSDMTIHDAGQIILIDCNKITVQDLELTNTIVGIQLLETCNCRISGNNVSSNNLDGIKVRSSNGNTISNNIISNNSDDGIYLEHSDKNIISGNEINNNGYGMRFFDNIEWPQEFSETSKFNVITRNNIIDNKQLDAYFHNSFFNRWDRNYWKSTRRPHCISGGIYMERGWGWGSPPPIDFSISRFDWHPARKPYDIPNGIVMENEQI